MKMTDQLILHCLSLNQVSMADFKKASHARSLIKGFSWRIVATVDTIVVVALVTSFTASGMDMGHALQIGLSEFLIKYLVYYFHERIWENFRSVAGLDKARTLKKAISWRIVATSMTFVIAGIVLQAFNSVTLAISIVEFFSKFVLYYIHERFWVRVPLGRIRKWLAKPRQVKGKTRQRLD